MRLREREVEAGEVLPESVGVVRAALLRARRCKEEATGLGQRARLLADAERFLELNPVEAVEQTSARLSERRGDVAGSTLGGPAQRSVPERAEEQAEAFELLVHVLDVTRPPGASVVMRVTLALRSRKLPGQIASDDVAKAR